MASRGSPKGISTMPINFRISALVPGGLIVESVAHLDDTILVTARAGIQVATCPLCESPSRRIHSRYVREVSDLPCSGRSVRLRVVTRRFCCDTDVKSERIKRLIAEDLAFLAAHPVRQSNRCKKPMKRRRRSIRKRNCQR